MIIGPDIALIREAAKTQVMRHFVQQAESDGTPPTLRAMYVMKAQQAEEVLAGGTSPMIELEAELRGYTPYQMARIIAYMAEESQDLEIARTKINVSIENAATESQITAIMKSIGLELKMSI